MEVYEVIRSIGSGNFGQVYLVRHKYEGRNYAVKKIKTRDISEKDRENTEQEIRLLQKLRHPNIVAYKDSYIDRDQFLCLVMVFCEGGDMYSKIKSSKGKKFPEAQILEWFAQILLALLYLHERKILHRDLKTQNIFLKNGRLRLGDFGIAKVLDGTRDFANTCIGTPYYMSPELFKNRPYSYKSDVWALGCVTYEMCNLRHAFDAQSFNGLAMKILKGSYPPLSPFYSKSLRDLVSRMLNVNPNARPSLIDLLNSPLIRKHVVLYLRDCLTPSNEPPDLDDMNVDSLRDQAERYNLMPLVTGEAKITAQPKPAEVSSMKLQKEEAEKQQMEEELKKLKEKRKMIREKLKKTSKTAETPKAEINQDEKRNTAEKGFTEEKKNALDKLNEDRKIKERRLSEEKRKLEERRNQIFEEQKLLVEEKKNLKDENKEAYTARERVLLMKEKRKKEEEERITHQLKEIHQQNIYNRQLAIEKQNAQFRTSATLQNAFTPVGVPNSLTREKEEEDPLPQEQPDLPEEVELMDDYEKLQEKYYQVKERIHEKTLRIEELRESMRFTGELIEPEVDEIPLVGDLELVEELEEEEVKEEPPSWQNKIRDRVKLLRHRCDAGLGNQLFERAYTTLKQTVGQSSADIRRALIGVLGEQNIGYWALLDQLSFMEQTLCNT
jgi:tRNA A-37 threonylcarbamoyl transferase component Bud32